MSLLVLVLAALIPFGHAAVVNPSASEKAAIMVLIQKGLDSRAEAERLSILMEAVETTDSEAWVKLDIKRQGNLNDAAWNFYQAVTETLTAYGIAPAGLAFDDERIAKQGPREGAPIRWAPSVITDPEHYFSYTDAQNATRYAGTVVTGGITWPDGSVSINLSMLTDSVESGHPGPLAYILHHESSHFQDKVSRRADTKQEGEVRAYNQTIQALPVFGLEDKKSVFEGKIQENLQELRSGQGRSSVPTPDEELVMKAQFELNLEKLQEINIKAAKIREAADRSYMDRQITNMKSICESACRQELRPGEVSGGGSEVINYGGLREQHLAELGGKPGTCAERLYTIILQRQREGWTLAPDWINKAVPADSVWKTRRREIKKLTDDALDCSMQTHIEKGSMTISGFSVEVGVERKKVRFYFDSNRDADAIRANFMLSYACLLAIHQPNRSQERDFKPICYDAVPALNARWDDVFFQKGLSLDVKGEEEESQCLEVLLGNLSFPLDEKRFTRAVSKTARQLAERKERDARVHRDNAKTWKRIEEQNRRIEERLQRAQERQDSRPRGGFDPKPAEDAIGRAKDMKLP